MVVEGHGGGAAGAHARTGAHAERARRWWLVPIAAVAVTVLALASWQALQLLPLGRSVSSTATSTQSPAVTSGVGTRTQVSISDSGALHVMETLTFVTGVTRIDLAVPERTGVGGSLSPTVTSMVVREPGPDRPVGPIDVGETTSVELEAASTVVVLEYDATGVVIPSVEPSSPERALALVTPLVVGQARTLPRTVEVLSVKVLNVGCLRRDALTGCGTQTTEGWTVETNGAEVGPRPDVLAQLNLAVP